MDPLSETLVQWVDLTEEERLSVELTATVLEGIELPSPTSFHPDWFAVIQHDDGIRVMFVLVMATAAGLVLERLQRDSIEEVHGEAHAIAGVSEHRWRTCQISTPLGFRLPRALIS